MFAMQLPTTGHVLQATRLPRPLPGPGQVLLQVTACGVCRTDLHVVDRELPDIKSGVVPGHEVVGRVVAVGTAVERWKLGDRLGVPWLGYACGRCDFCKRSLENLCPNARFTGYTMDGGYADYVVAEATFCLALPDCYDDGAAAPLLCAGLIGYRAYAMAPDARKLGIYGFGAAAHIIAQLAVQQGREVFAFTRPGDAQAQKFARSLGAIWAGDSTDVPPESLDAALIFAPVGGLVPLALRAVRPGGSVICAGIHMSDIPSFPYSLLWGERSLRSVANLTRADGEAFLGLVARYPINSTVTLYLLTEANLALDDLREGRLNGAAVLIPDALRITNGRSANHTESPFRS